MASVKTVTVLDDNVTLTAGAADRTSSVATLTTGYGGQLHIKHTNGATGPTVASQSQVWVSPDNSNWYKLGGALVATLGNNAITSWSVPIPIGVGYVEVISGSNTGQDVALRVEIMQVTAIS